MSDVHGQGLIDQGGRIQEKMMELMCLISAGSFALMSSLRTELGSELAKYGMLCLILTIISVLFWFKGRSRQLCELGLESSRKPSSTMEKNEYWWMTLSRIGAWISFILAYVLLFLQYN